MMYIPSFRKIGVFVQKLLDGTTYTDTNTVGLSMTFMEEQCLSLRTYYTHPSTFQGKLCVQSVLGLQRNTQNFVSRTSSPSVYLASAFRCSGFDLARFLSAWVVQLSCKADVHQLRNVMRGGFRSIIAHTHCSYCARTDKLFLGQQY